MKSDQVKHQETLKFFNNSSLMSFIASTVIVLFILILITFANYMYRVYDIPYFSYLVVLIVVAAGVFIYKRIIVEYRYSIINNKLYLEQLAGNKVRHYSEVNLDSNLVVKSVEEYNNKADKGSKPVYYVYKKNLPEVYIIEKKESKEIIFFKPSRQLLDIVKNHVTE